MLDIFDHGNIKEIRLARPPANALNKALFDALDRALRSASQSSEAVVVSGQPGMFSAGLDIPELLQLDRPDLSQMLLSFLQTIRTLATMPVPTAFALTGHAPAGGMVLALFGDYRIMPRGPFKTGLNEVRVGLMVPSMVHGALVRLIGAHHAERILVSGELMDAEKAADVGLVDELVENPEAVVSRAIEWCAELLALPGAAMSETRKMARADFRTLIDIDLEKEAMRFTDIWCRDETQAILRAMVESLKKRD